VVLDDAAPGRMLRFSGNCGVIRADRPEDVAGAFALIEEERSRGRFVAGYFSYELGLLLEPKLASLLPPERAVPLLWFGVFEGREAFTLESAARAYAGPLRHEWDEAGYHARFERVRRYILDGDIYQANLSFRSRFVFAGDPLALYARLRAASNAAYGAYIDDGERQVLSLSPELFFDLSADGRITAKPMKGTIARGIDPASDEAARARLAASEKDRAENLMIVDLLRNDLGRVAEIGSVRVENLFAVETYPTLHTMVSTVRARVRRGTGVERLVRAIFPCGSITGAPKIRAMQVIRELEASPRGLYCGAMGHFAPDGSARFNVAIRTLTITGGEGELGIGGAVVQDSASRSEFEECLLKARYYESTRRPLELIETLRSDGGRLERHLARMARSAAVFGIPFDRARLALPRMDAPSRLRIVLDESGAFHCTAAPLGETLPRWTYRVSPEPVRSGDVLARHKTSWREHLAPLPGADETIFLNERGEVAEGSRSTVFVARGGMLLTPPLEAGVLDGVLRRELIEQGRCREATLTLRDLAEGEAWLGNSLRGLIAAVPAPETF